MKFFLFLLSFFMLYISCLPCSDSRIYNVKTEEHIAATDHHRQPNRHSDTCTPFCTCSCCAASTFFSPFFKPQAINPAIPSEEHSLYNVAFHNEVYYSIWQPPKIS